MAFQSSTIYPRWLIKRSMLMIISALLLLLLYMGYLYYEIMWRPVLAHGSLPMEFTIRRGDSVRKMAYDLQKRGLLRSGHLFSLVFLSRHTAQNMYAGSYIIRPGDTLDMLVGRVSRGEVLQYGFTIVEGWNWQKILQSLKNDKRFAHSDVADVKRFFLKQPFLGAGNQLTNLEGLFLPETYHFSSGVRDVDMLAHAYSESQAFLRQSWEQRADNVAVKSPYEALILASLIERESGYRPEYVHVSSVIHNRLRIGMPIQIDAAVLYGRDPSRKGPLTIDDLKRPSRYNTYLNKGLPPSPICMPSRAAIHAALHPDDNVDLFYVAMPNGRHYFSKEFSQHVRAKLRFKKRSK